MEALINKEKAIHALITTSVFYNMPLETLAQLIKKIDEISIASKIYCEKCEHWSDEK